MQKNKDKLPKSILITPLAVIVCCFDPVIFLSFTTGAILSFLKNNKIGLSTFNKQKGAIC